mmetsp:Transcript_3180/g.7023  ORF Transcript_3180/g.7023 Transcript_3180/m.7023 type:complete len:368 (-) Transcript_3180:548-1651(-)
MRMRPAPLLARTIIPPPWILPPPHRVEQEEEPEEPSPPAAWSNPPATPRGTRSSTIPPRGITSARSWCGCTATRRIARTTWSASPAGRRSRSTATGCGRTIGPSTSTRYGGGIDRGPSPRVPATTRGALPPVPAAGPAMAGGGNRRDRGPTGGTGDGARAPPPAVTADRPRRAREAGTVVVPRPTPTITTRPPPPPVPLPHPDAPNPSTRVGATTAAVEEIRTVTVTAPPHRESDDRRRKTPSSPNRSCPTPRDGPRPLANDAGSSARRTAGRIIPHVASSTTLTRWTSRSNNVIHNLPPPNIPRARITTRNVRRGDDPGRRRDASSPSNLPPPANRPGNENHHRIITVKAGGNGREVVLLPPWRSQ